MSGAQTSEEVSGYAKRVAEELARSHGSLVTARMTRSLRPGKVFIDWSQNAAAKTTVAPYSLRAQPGPTVSAPLTWDEVEAGHVVATDLTAAVVLERVEEWGDLLEPLLEPGTEVPVRAT